MNVNLVSSFWIFDVAMGIVYLLQTILILAEKLVTERCCAVAWIRIVVMRLVMMIT